MVKLSGWGMLNDDVRAQLRVAAAEAAVGLLADAADRQQQQPPLLEGAEASAAAAGGKSGCSSGHAATAMLPSVGILGRCYMQWGETAPISPEQNQMGPTSAQEQQQQQQERGDYLEMAHDDVMSILQQWLAAGACDQLATAGYTPLPLLQQLEQLVATGQALRDNPSDAAVLLVRAQQLRSTGLALCSFAVPCMCNNPGCTSMAGLSELAAVSGRSCICGGCRVARYCGRACQRAAWKQHKPVCAAISAAAGGAGVGAVAAAGTP
jgi:hypothetical protein